MADPWSVVSRAPLPAQADGAWSVVSRAPLAEPKAPGTLDRMRQGMPEVPQLPDTAPERAPYRNQPTGLDQKAIFEKLEKTPEDSPEYADLSRQLARSQAARAEEAASFMPLGTVGKGVAGAVKAAAPTAQRLLMNEGVRLTPGQMAGGAIKATEDKATSIPITGDAISAARRRGIEDLNRAGYSRALKEIGETFTGKSVGREGIGEVEKKLSDAYERLKPKMNFQGSPEFVQDLDALGRQVAELPPPQAEQMKQIVQNRLLSRLAQGGKMDGETFKQVESELGHIAATYRSSGDAAQRELAARLTDLQGILREQLERSSPEIAGELKKLNTGWAVFTRLQSAAQNRVSSGGVFTPGDLSASVRKMDKSTRKGAFARGDALLQDLSDAGSEVLPSKVPDSGTAGRAMLAGGTLGAAEMIHHPELILGLVGGALPYTRPGIAAANALADPAVRAWLASKARPSVDALRTGTGLIPFTAPNISDYASQVPGQQ